MGFFAEDEKRAGSRNVEFQCLNVSYTMGKVQNKKILSVCYIPSSKSQTVIEIIGSKLLDRPLVVILDQVKDFFGGGGAVIVRGNKFVRFCS